MQIPREVTQAEIDDAIVACLRIFAARGRALRQQREKIANAPGSSESAPCVVEVPDQKAGCGETGQEHRREEGSAQNSDCP